MKRNDAVDDLLMAVVCRPLLNFTVMWYIDVIVNVNVDRFDFPTNNVLLMACGSGLAPIAAAIESSQLGLKTQGFNSLFQRTATLYIGAKVSTRGTNELALSALFHIQWLHTMCRLP
jgi:hypothetical protein